MQTVGSETSQYHEEKKPIGISLVAASENESSPNRRFAKTVVPQGRMVLVDLGVVRQL